MPAPVRTVIRGLHPSRPGTRVSIGDTAQEQISLESTEATRLQVPGLDPCPHTFSNMSSLTVRASGPADAHDVWEAFADPQRWAQWAPHIRRVDAIGRLRPGLAGQVWSVVPAPLSFDVTAVDAKRRRWSWQAGFGPVRVRCDHGVDERAAGCGTWLTMHGPLPVLLIYVPFARIALHRLVRTPAAAPVGSVSSG